MNSEQGRILSSLFALTHAHLDREDLSFPIPKWKTLLEGTHFIQLTSLSRFWEPEQTLSLEQSAEDLILSFYGLGSRFVYLLKGCSNPAQIQCWYGFERQPSGSDHPLDYALLSSAFPDLRTAAIAPFQAEPSRSFPYALTLTGTPTTKLEAVQGSRADQIERLCRGLYGQDWVFWVQAEPLGRQHVLALNTETQHQLAQLFQNYYLKATLEAEPSPFVVRYRGLLEAKQQKCELGRFLGMWRVQTCLFTGDRTTQQLARGLLLGAFAGEQSIPDPVRVTLGSSQPTSRPEDIETLRSLLNSRELAILTRPPKEAYPGYEVVDYARFGVGNSTGQGDIWVGEICDRGIATGNHLKLPLTELTKHGLIVGVTGSGKTNTCFQLLEQVWAQGIPFLVIESAKSEYRRLLNDPRFTGASGQKRLTVFTVGDESLSPLRLNPFEVPEGILIQTHIDYLKSLFVAAFDLFAPLPYILELSLQEVYQDRGWHLPTNRNQRMTGSGEPSNRQFPTLSDLVVKVQVVADRMGYAGEVAINIKSALVGRLDQLRSGGGKGPMFNSRTSVPDSVLFEAPCILELKQVISDDEKAFLMGLLLMRLYEYYEARQTLGLDSRHPHTGSAGLQHVTLIEEAHRLLRNVSTEQGGEGANPKGKAIEVFANILAEIRAYGESILIAEQIPVKLTPDAIKNTNLKVVHRLVSEDDRRILGHTLNLDEAQSNYLARLQTGQAIAYTEGLQQPVLLQVKQHQLKDLQRQVDAAQIQQSFWREDYETLKRPLPGCQHCPLSQPGRSCGERSGRRADRLLNEAFKQLFNTLRQHPVQVEQVLNTYQRFEHQCQQFQRRFALDTSSYCLFVELLETEVERRGELANWPLADVERIVRLGQAIAAWLTTHQGEADLAAPLQTYGKGELLDDLPCDDSFLSYLSNSLRNLYTIDRGAALPYVGCTHCPKPCHYRFDMQFRATAPEVKELESLAQENDSPLTLAAKIAEKCEEIASRYFLNPDITGAAFCLAVQYISLHSLSQAEQDSYAKEIASQIVLTARS